MQLIHAGYLIQDGLEHVDWECVHRWLASSYWTPGIARERVERAARHSALVMGAYIDGKQAGFLRVISDQTRFAYLCDVWVDEAHRGRGLARAMVRAAMEHPDFATVSHWLLRTLDAQGVYRAIGFTPVTDPESWMLCHRQPR